MSPRRFPICIFAAIALIGCSTKTATTPEATPTMASGPPAASSPPPSSAAPLPTSAPAPTASATAPAADPAASSAAPPAPPQDPLPAVKVTNIGMHIGGGPNDAITKEPIRRSVEPHFDEFRRCFGLLDDGKKGGDFGLDLRIDKAGGRAKLSHPRTMLKGKAFEECVVKVFEAIDFRKPRGGTTTVSYSLRFTP